MVFDIWSKQFMPSVYFRVTVIGQQEKIMGDTSK